MTAQMLAPFTLQTVNADVYSVHAAHGLHVGNLKRICVVWKFTRIGGVSYMLEERKMMMRLFPALFNAHRVAPITHYPDLLLRIGNSTA